MHRMTQPLSPSLDDQLQGILSHFEQLKSTNPTNEASVKKALAESRCILGALAQYRHMLQRTLAATAIVLVFIVAASVPTVQAQTTTAAAFLKIEPDSRAAAMGGASVALADAASATFWNPAGLAFQKGTELALTHSNWLPEFNAGLFYEHFVAKHHLNGWGTLGGHVTYLFLGEQESRDEQNNPTGTFRSFDLAVGVSYGFKVSERFALGTGLRLIYSNLGSGQIVGSQEAKIGISAGFDLAGLYRTRPFEVGSMKTTLSAGFNLTNMGPKIQYADQAQADPIPTNLRLGYAVTFEFDEYNTLTWVADFNKDLVHVDSSGSDPFYEALFSSWRPMEVRSNALNEHEASTERLGVLAQMTMGTGLEYWYNNLLALRTGYFYEHPLNGNRQFLTFGAGVRYHIVGVDFSYIYALEENSPLSNTMRLSLLLTLDR